MLFDRGEVQYTDGSPLPEILARFEKRGDNQIASLEILAIAMGLSTFCAEQAHRSVVVYSDNVVAEVSIFIISRLSARLPMPHVKGVVRRGSATAYDQCALVHEIWTLV